MSQYIGNSCPVCGELFREGDDVVVCPDCGTPYHRNCWQQHGTCLFADRHAAGYEWKPDKAPDDPALTCPNCGTRNEPGADKCSHCGVPMPDPNAPTQEDNGPRPIYASAPPSGAAQQGPAYTEATPNGFVRKELRPEDPIDGIQARDWATFVGQSSFYYLMQFFRMQETKHKVSVCFSAFFFGPLYFFYRKMWKEGILFSVLSLFLTLPYAISLLAVSGSPLVSSFPIEVFTALNLICSLVDWAQKVLRGLFAVYWYKKDAARKIQQICDTVPAGPDRDAALAVSGGTSLLGVTCFIAVLFVFAGILVRLMGPNLQAVLSYIGM